MHADQPSTVQKVAFLAGREAHLEARWPVVVVETHFAWVFLADGVVRKLKKPLRTPWGDLSTLEARFAACREEVAINRRLGGDVYQGVEQLVRRPDGSLAIGRLGEPVEALVRMRRLPDARCLDRLRRRPETTVLDDVADLLAGFYREGRC
ncbi:MAG: hypothetical protein ACOCYE_12230, partial [Pseudomonadota bacterium]